MKTDSLAKEYGLPYSVAQEIISEEIQRALRTRWQAWAWLLASLSLCIWLEFFATDGFWYGTLWVFLGCLFAWGMIGRHYAVPGIRKAAKDKADRLRGTYP